MIGRLSSLSNNNDSINCSILKPLKTAQKAQCMFNIFRGEVVVDGEGVAVKDA